MNKALWGKGKIFKGMMLWMNQRLLADYVENIRVLQTLLGHKDVKTTEIYTHVMQKNYDNIKSPLDDIEY